MSDNPIVDDLTVGKVIGKKDYTVVGDIHIAVFKDGRAAAHAVGFKDKEGFYIKVLAAQIAYVALNNIRRKGGEAEFILLKRACTLISRVANDLIAKATKEKPLIITPDLIGEGFN